MSCKPGEPLRRVQRGMTRMQQVARRVIDIHQHRVETAARRIRIEAVSGMRHGKEVAVDEAAARIIGQWLAERQQSLLMPLDHFGQRVDHDQGSHARMFQHRLRGVAKPEAANDDIQVRPFHSIEAKPRQRDLGDGELARHQEFVAEFDFIDIEAGRELPAPPQGEHAHRGGAKIQFLKIDAHAPPP